MTTIRADIVAATATENPTTTMIHIMALDSMVNANSLFTFALFVGMVNVPINPIDPSFTLVNSSCTTTNTTSYHNRTAKGSTASSTGAYDSTMAQNLVAFHIYSFTSFLFSSLVALALKQAIKISSFSCSPTSSFSRHQVSESGGDCCHRARELDGRWAAAFVQVDRRMLLAGLMASSVSSVSGCIFLLLALVDLVQIKLGSVFTCSYNLYSAAAIVPLIVLVPFSLFAYICILFHAFVN